MRGTWVLNGFLLLVLVALAGLHWLILPDPSRRNVLFLPNMVGSPALDAQYPARIGNGGELLDLRPPEGSVARGFLPLAYPAGPEGARRAGMELRSPIQPGDQEALARGRVVYGTFCTVCHGPGGLGRGTVTTRGVPPPPSLLAPNARGMSDGRMYHVISQGQGNMTSYASQVQRQDRWKVIAYIRSLQADAEAGAEAP